MSHEIYTSCKRLSPSNWYGMMIFSNCSDSCSHRPAEFASWFWDMTWDDMNLQHIGIVLPAFLTTLDIIHHWNRGTMHERYIDCLSEVGVQNPVFFFCAVSQFTGWFSAHISYSWLYRYTSIGSSPWNKKMDMWEKPWENRWENPWKAMGMVGNHHFLLVNHSYYPIHIKLNHYFLLVNLVNHSITV